MKIKDKISQHRRDFIALMICEHCGYEYLEENGYDDENYHKNVIPNIKCKKCNKTSDENYEPMKTIYPQGYII